MSCEIVNKMSNLGENFYCGMPKSFMYRIGDSYNHGIELCVKVSVNDYSETLVFCFIHGKLCNAFVYFY